MNDDGCLSLLKNIYCYFQKIQYPFVLFYVVLAVPYNYN